MALYLTTKASTTRNGSVDGSKSLYDVAKKGITWTYGQSLFAEPRMCPR